MSYLISEGAAPSTPASGKVAVYAKTDGRVYGKDDVGTEFSMSGPNSGTSTSATGTSVDFTGLPLGIKKITVALSGVSGSATSNFMIQIGDSGGIETTGYLGSNAYINTPTFAAFTTGIGLTGTTVAGAVWHGSVTLVLENSNNNTWVASSALSRSDAAAVTIGTGSKSLTSVLDRVRITTVNGTDTFDAGEINILYE